MCHFESQKYLLNNRNNIRWLLLYVTKNIGGSKCREPPIRKTTQSLYEAKCQVEINLLEEGQSQNFVVFISYTTAATPNISQARNTWLR